MNNTAMALHGYAGWTPLLIVLVELIRTYWVVAKGNAAAAFKPDGSALSPFMARLSRAHANCVENFPIVGGLFQSAKRKARGYGNFRTIRAVLFLVAGMFNFRTLNLHLSGQFT